MAQRPATRPPPSARPGRAAAPDPDDAGAVAKFYDALAGDYADRMCSDLAPRPVDRGMLAAFAELALPGRPIADVGCGRGSVAAHLARLGLPVLGIDLSAVMLGLARTAHPALPLVRGSLAALGLADEALGGLVAFYSLIHVQPAARAGVCAEFGRVLAAGAPLLLAFQVGDQPAPVTAPDGRTYADGRPAALTFHRLQPDDIAALLSGAGFTMTAQVVREPVEAEKVPQALLLAVRKESP